MRSSAMLSVLVVANILDGTAVSAGPPAQPVHAGVDRLVNNNAGATGTAYFTQSETSLIAFGNTIVVGFNDSGSFPGAPNVMFTGFAYSTDGGATFTDGGTLPTNPDGDVGDPVLARDDTTGRLYFMTLGWNARTVQVFRSDDGGRSWSAPVNGTPGGGTEDKPWLRVDNFPGSGRGNVYLVSRTYGGGNGIYFYRSTDGGDTFGPTLGTLMVSEQQGAFVTVGPDHSVYVFWHEGSTLQMRKSTDQGLSFAEPLTVVSGLTAPDLLYGGLGLYGIRQGTAGPTSFGTNSYPHVAVNPISGHIYVTYNDNVPGADKADVFMVMSTNGGATWSSPVRVNDDATSTDQWMPTIAVTPGGEWLGIFYYSRQDDPVDNNLFMYYGRVGSISGSTVTFTPSVAVSDTPSLPEFGRDAVVRSDYMGDYNTASATDGVFHITWSDNRDDLALGPPRKDPNVYYDQIAVGNASVLGIDRVLAARLTPAAPNPFRNTTTLAFEQPDDGDITLEVYSPTGALVRTLAQGRWQAGRYQVAWNGKGSGGRSLPSGVYFVRLTAGRYTSQSKIVKLP